MQVVLDLREVLGEKTPVGTNGVATQRHAARMRHVLLDKSQCCGTCFGQGHVRLPDRRQQTRLSVHGDHHWVHRCKGGFGGVDDQVGAFGHDVEVIIGNQRSDLHDHIHIRIQSGHL